MRTRTWRRYGLALLRRSKDSMLSLVLLPQPQLLR